MNGRAKTGPQACLAAKSMLCLSRWAASAKMCSFFGIDVGHPLDLSGTGSPTIKRTFCQTLHLDSASRITVISRSPQMSPSQAGQDGKSHHPAVSPRRDADPVVLRLSVSGSVSGNSLRARSRSESSLCPQYHPAWGVAQSRGSGKWLLNE